MLVALFLCREEPTTSHGLFLLTFQNSEPVASLDPLFVHDSSLRAKSPEMLANNGPWKSYPFRFPTISAQVNACGGGGRGGDSLPSRFLWYGRLWVVVGSGLLGSGPGVGWVRGGGLGWRWLDCNIAATDDTRNLKTDSYTKLILAWCLLLQGVGAHPGSLSTISPWRSLQFVMLPPWTADLDVISHSAPWCRPLTPDFTTG